MMARLEPCPSANFGPHPQTVRPTRSVPQPDPSRPKICAFSKLYGQNKTAGSFSGGRRLFYFYLVSTTRYVWMMRGVMKKISSWLEVLTVVCLNRLPRYGMLPSNGTCVTLSEFWV
jgi:hypothetical protein